MIEILIALGFGILIGRDIHRIRFRRRRLNLTKWLELRDVARVHLYLYNGADYARVRLLVATLGFFCEKTAACTHYVQAREALFYARNATMVLSQLHSLGFFEKTQKETID